MYTNRSFRALRSSPLAALALLLPLAIAGCDAHEFADEGEISFRPGGGWGCTHCTIVLGNSPNINGADLSDINLDGTNTSGIKLKMGTTPGNRPFRLEVDTASESFIGINPQDPEDILIKGAGFVGAKIVLEMPGAIDVALEITGYDDDIESWAQDGAALTAYRATYLSNGQYQSLCPSTSPENQAFTLILGETYKRGTGSQTGILSIDKTPRSVTLACVGEAAAKMKLMDFHPLGNRGADTDERMATLRMITADYCGDGTPYTATGIPVAWRDADDLMQPPTSEDLLEAMWTANGARCLDSPRLTSLDLIHCQVPTCNDDGTFLSDDVWRTMLPH